MALAVVLFFHFPFLFFLFYSFRFLPLSVTHIPSGLLYPMCVCVGVFFHSIPVPVSYPLISSTSFNA
ncbi:hypothetical protein F5148DRAFT_1270723 [Russula earlei]|uniref:Uncharacterized protein n=1 Tax=Russula earlei TaxID=71964 RepID=A0ACC0TSQ4_9AGAM|nr:hypothetical protein F5148DRAFT_1270723 [Russula earlei]